MEDTDEITLQDDLHYGEIGKINRKINNKNNMIKQETLHQKNNNIRITEMETQDNGANRNMDI